MAVATEPVAAGLRARARGGGLRRGGSAEPPQAAAHGGLGAPAAGSPMVPFPGALAACCLARAGGPRCLRARGARQRQLALLARPPVSIVQPRSALSSLFFLLPPTLPVSLPPPSLALLSLSLLLPPSRLPGWLTSSRAPPLAPAASAPAAPPGLLLPWSRPTMTRRAPSSRDVPAGPGPRRGHPEVRRALPRGPRPPSRSSARAIVRAVLGRLPEPRRKSPGRGGDRAEGGADGRSPGSRGSLRPLRALLCSGSRHLPAPPAPPSPPCSQVRAGNPDLPAHLLQPSGSVPKPDRPVPRGWTSSFSFLTNPWSPCPWRPL